MQNAATDPIVEHVEAGRDVRIEGIAASARLGAVATLLEGDFNVIRLTAPVGGLSLSALIAQLSGRENFDDQDDGALELGFRRLCGDDEPDRQTILLLDAVHGMQRPVLRYLQQAGRAAPRLQFVIASFPELEAFLATPDMVRLQTRLGTVVEADGEAAATEPSPADALQAATPALATVPVLALRIPPDWTIDPRRQIAAPKRRPPRRAALVWTTSGLAMLASAALGFWLGQTQTSEPGVAVADAKSEIARPAAEPDRRTDLTMKPVPADLALPPLAAKVPPSPAGKLPSAGQSADVPGVVPAAIPAPALAKASSPAAAAAAEPPAAAPTRPEPVTLASQEHPPIPAMPSRTAVEPHRPVRSKAVARVRPPAGMPRYAEERPLDYYGPEELPPEAMLPEPPRGRFRAGREPAPGEYDVYGRAMSGWQAGPEPRDARYDRDYIGTFSTGPYGARVFRYGP